MVAQNRFMAISFLSIVNLKKARLSHPLAAALITQTGEYH
jgi:hypothetical protein